MIDARHRNTALLVSGCFFMEMLDGTIVITASPQIAQSLHAPATEIGLVVTAYLLTLAVLIPLSGWLTRRLGNRTVFLSAIALFTLASVGCAISTSLGELVAMRVLQGAGGAMMVPVGRTMVVSAAAKEDLLRVTSYVVWPGLLAPVIAPLAGGLITTYASWHWIFLINVPLGVIAFAAARRLVARGRDSAAPPPLDWAGVVLTCAGLGGLTYTAHLVSLPAPPPVATAAFGLVSAALLAAAFWHLRDARHPLINLRTLTVPTFRVSQFGGTAYWLVCGAMPFLLPLLFQTQFGWSPVKSGAVTAFVFVGNVGIKPATTPLINRFGFRRVLVAATAGTTVAVAALGFTTAATPVAVIAALTLVSGITRSVGFTVQHGRARRHGPIADAGREHARRHEHPARRGPGDRDRHGGAADRRPATRRRRPRRRADGLHRGVLPARRLGQRRREAGRRPAAPPWPPRSPGPRRAGCSWRRACSRPASATGPCRRARPYCTR